ncbi:MAG: hypothetical protein EA376_07660 [Phycisphaeraceae bacterium]|nr:MAG: hypothetical protein EA376_07660 [Phycisphaeraceae bacterium]
MVSQEYTVRLDNFEGPLDLLLHLIRRAEVDITDIPISTVADQYMEHLREIERIDIELAGEFLVMAATLMEIKSRLLAPRRRAEGEEGEDEGTGGSDEYDLDPRAELVQQLLEYKRSRDAAETLERMRDEWSRRYGAAGLAFDAAALDAASEHRAEMELEDLELYDLVEAFGRIVEQVNFDTLGDHRVETGEEDVPLELHMEDVLDRLRTGAAPEIPFRDVFTGRTRVEMIGLFLAILELVRRREVRVKQEEQGGEIVIGLREQDADDEAATPNEDGSASA